MEPQIIDYYNTMPMGINVIDKMNEEFIELQKKYDELDKIINKYRTPCFKVDTVEEYNGWTKKLEKFTEKNHEIIKDEKYGLMSILNAEIPCYGIYDRLSWGEGRALACRMTSELIDELNKLTEYKNKEWSAYRIRYSLKEILSKYTPNNFDLDRVSQDISVYIMRADENNEFDPEAPILYCNFIPENCEENEEYPISSTYIHNIIYYDCEKCNKLGRYGEPENVDNKLLCSKCHLNTLYPGDY